MQITIENELNNVSSLMRPQHKEIDVMCMVMVYDLPEVKGCTSVSRCMLSFGSPTDVRTVQLNK